MAEGAPIRVTLTRDCPGARQRRYTPGSTARVDPRVVAAAMDTLTLGSLVFRDYANARGRANMSDEQFVTERALLTASLHDWNRAAD